MEDSIINDQSFPKRKSVRLHCHDYNGGIYFVTVCTHQKLHTLGQIDDAKMHLSPLGLLLDQAIKHADSTKNVFIPHYVIMPNHFHAIIEIDGNSIYHASNKTEDEPESVSAGVHNNSKLSTTIGGIKSFVTRNTACSTAENIVSEKVKIWQPRFHDHIIRNQKELNLISNYISNNIIRWEEDCFYTRN